MVEMLLPASGVPSRRLQMPLRVRTNPHLFPGRRNDEGFDTRQFALVMQRLALGREVTEPLAQTPAADAGRFVCHINEPGSLRCLLRWRLNGEDFACRCGCILPGRLLVEGLWFALLHTSSLSLSQLCRRKRGGRCP